MNNKTKKFIKTLIKTFDIIFLIISFLSLISASFILIGVYSTYIRNPLLLIISVVTLMWGVFAGYLYFKQFENDKVII